MTFSLSPLLFFTLMALAGGPDPEEILDPHFALGRLRKNRSTHEQTQTGLAAGVYFDLRNLPSPSPQTLIFEEGKLVQKKDESKSQCILQNQEPEASTLRKLFLLNDEELIDFFVRQGKPDFDSGTPGGSYQHNWYVELPQGFVLFASNPYSQSDAGKKPNGYSHFTVRTYPRGTHSRSVDYRTRSTPLNPTEVAELIREHLGDLMGDAEGFNFKDQSQWKGALELKQVVSIDGFVAVYDEKGTHTKGRAHSSASLRLEFKRVQGRPGVYVLNCKKGRPTGLGKLFGSSSHAEEWTLGDLQKTLGGEALRLFATPSLPQVTPASLPPQAVSDTQKKLSPSPGAPAVSPPSPRSSQEAQ